MGGTTFRLLQCLALGPLVTKVTGRGIRILGLKPNKGLDEMTALVEAGTVVPSIDSVCPLGEVPQALTRFGQAEHKGKIVISVP